MEGKTKEFLAGPFSSARRALGLAGFVAVLTALALSGGGKHLDARVLAFLAVGIALALFSRIPSRVIVGSDGILLRSLFYREFIPYGSIDHVALRNVYGGKDPRRSTGIELSIERTHGKPIGVSPRGDSRALFEAVVEARRAHRARTVGAFDTHALRPAGSDGKAWLERLRMLSDRVQGFRVDAPSREELLAIIEDTHADEDTRAAASVVVAASQDDEATTRLRVALESTASPRLRVAMEAAIEGEDAAVAEALDALRSES